jgi:hypothetical protein
LHARKNLNVWFENLVPKLSLALGVGVFTPFDVDALPWNLFCFWFICSVSFPLFFAFQGRLVMQPPPWSAEL